MEGRLCKVKKMVEVEDVNSADMIVLCSDLMCPRIAPRFIHFEGVRGGH